MTDWQDRLDTIAQEARHLSAQGRVATYIPALARVPLDRFGIALLTADGEMYSAGDADTAFSIQSISKIFTLASALDRFGDAIWQRVGREPSGMSFNSLVLLEMEGGVPRNPLINAGAIVTMDAMLEGTPDWAADFLATMRGLAESEAVKIDGEVLASERDHGDLNRAIAWFLKAKGNLRCHPDQVTEAYFSACAISASCVEMARAARFLMGPGHAGAFCNHPDRSRRIRAVMRTCGLYDAAGDFAYRVGLPAKSGVGGGIVAVKPEQYAVCVWSPALDSRGNSVAGVRALELLEASAP